jgi:hypothetical protein
MRPTSVVALVVATCAALALAGCQRGEEPTRNDASTIEAMLSSSASVQRAVQPLYMCFPGQKRCYREAGRTVVQVVQAERERVAPVMAAADDGCLRDVGRLYTDSLDAYLAAGQAALAGNSRAVDKAFSKSTESEIAYNERLGECGFAQGRFAELGASMRGVSIEIARLDEKMYACANEGCVKPLARQLEQKAAEATGILNEFHATLGEAPACLDHAIIELRSSFVAVERSAVALQKGDYETAVDQATLAGTVRAQAQEDLAACLASFNT